MDDSHSPPATRARWLSPPLLALYAVVIAFFVLSALFVAYELFYRDRVIFGVSALGQPMNGLSRAEAQKFLQDKFGQPDAILKRTGGEAILLRDGDRAWRAWPWELGLRTDFGPVAQSALLLGHRGALPENVIEQARCLLAGCDIGLDAQFDVNIAQAYLSWLAPQVERPPRDAAVHIEGLRVVATPAQNGRDLDGAAMLERMRERVLGSTQGDIPLAFRETTPLIADGSAAKAQAEAILAAPVLMTFNARSWAIDQAALAAMISIHPQSDGDGKLRLATTLDRAQLLATVKPLAADINQPARDARFHFNPDTKTLTPIVTSQYGQILDPEAAVKQIEQQLMANASRGPGAASPLETLKARVVSLPVQVIKPTIAMEDAAKFGIKELASQGVSNFKGSPAGRIQNIRTAAAQFDGIVIAPGATFSFDQYLGDVVEAEGYDDAYVIFQDRTVLGPGGGVCQVSTTMFRAAFWGGYPFVERWAHAYRVGYYEPPVGLDATVFTPSVDLKFKNDTDNYILIEPIVDLKKTTITFNFWGTKPNRTVEMQDPIIENVIKSGPAIYTNDPTLKKGVTKQVDFAHDGMDVTIWRTIKVNGQVVKKDKFFSRYEPWVARYQVGTKP
ncbi:MAG: VanW family protein [Chloroflexi bacterium]|nr:VanW family protein [Chloroflexota bacterium]